MIDCRRIFFDQFESTDRRRRRMYYEVNEEEGQRRE
jgi:hypothetical protein